jgi:CubicO group peptidase (beta-lactamase class C family)
MGSLEASVDQVATASRFSGVARVDRGGRTEVARAYGLACRRCEVANGLATRFATASVTKGFTALAVVRLLEQGLLDFATPVRSLLGDELPMVADDVTIEHLLAHRSGIGDYLDEDGWEPTDHVLAVPVHRLAAAEDYLAVLDGQPTVSPAGERFAYNNGGYVILAIVAERVAGVPYHDLVRREVFDRAGMTATAFLRSDELPPGAAVGYLDVEGPRGNVLHLPVRGVGDGGATSTAADLHRFWEAFVGGRIVGPRWVDELVRPRSEDTGETLRYGLGFWLSRTGDGVVLEGYDAGISARSAHDRASGTTWTVLSNTSEGAWPLVRLLTEEVGP